ncbi:hypothetical protein FZEAL_121 [Fusarium zealandicum]|uniref:Uncharacterized protein n=1 Tax=Fusarium zealandicum TaxID=1053134 RepID=A0A8H4XQ35_9HYPO|nr:hypothetical protein FZEAL_121 [Fusarium zealandicum]
MHRHQEIKIAMSARRNMNTARTSNQDATWTNQIFQSVQLWMTAVLGNKPPTIQAEEEFEPLLEEESVYVQKQAAPSIFRIATTSRSMRKYSEIL